MLYVTKNVVFSKKKKKKWKKGNYLFTSIDGFQVPYGRFVFNLGIVV